MNATPDQRTVTRVPGVDRHDTGEGLVLYTSTNDTVHQLNAMSTLIYELADGRTVESIAHSFVSVFDLDLSRARQLVLDGVEELTRRDLVR